MSRDLVNKLYRPTWAEVDLSAIEYNFNQVKKKVGNKVKILVVIKADAYGHGAVSVANKLSRCKAVYFGVATFDEAIELRENKIDNPILLLSNLLPNKFEALIKYNIIPTIADSESAFALDRNLKQVKKKIPVHIKIDTGMGRIGVWHKYSIDFIKGLLKLEHLILEGIYTHFPSADEDAVFTRSQIQSFKNLVGYLESIGIYIPLRHAANSSAIMRYRDSYFNLVRPGLMIYGLYPDIKSKRYIKLRPAMSFKTKITYLKEVTSGRSISYGRTYITKRKTKIATLPVGYADGYSRLLSNRADVIVKGVRCPVVGRICMDHTMIDVTGIEANVGDEVVLIGRQNKSEISAEEISHLCSTISYEVVCWVSKRVPRIYI